MCTIILNTPIIGLNKYINRVVLTILKYLLNKTKIIIKNYIHFKIFLLYLDS